MTEHALVTIVAKIPIEKVVEVRETIDQELGNPASPDFRKAVAPEGKEPFLHFASLHAIAGSAGDQGYLVLEFSADGDAKAAVQELAERAGHLFAPIFAEAEGFTDGDDIGRFWLDRVIHNGFGMGDDPGITFAGTPGLSAADIAREKDLAGHVAGLLIQQGNLPPLDRLDDIRAKLDNDQWRWALSTPPPLPHRPDAEPSLLSNIGILAWPFVRSFAWPLLLLMLLVSVLLVWPERWVWQDFGPIAGWHFGEWVRVVGQVLGFVGGVLGLTALFSAFALGLIYLALRRAEESDWVSDRRPDEDELTKMEARENDADHVQNHMMSHTVRKPGWLRKVTNRLAFFVVATLTARNPKVGHLGDIGTIHFARWITIPGTRDFIFFSNYGGSWESYLEDFITKAHEGLTAVWSNAVGFPRSKNLFQDGATDGERFKRYARQSMVHTPFWYSAYPQLSTANIRSNHTIRRGLAAAMGEKEAVEWLAQFGSTVRPHDKLETSQMQSILFGGMGFKPEGVLLLVRLSEEVAYNRVFLDMLMPYIAFGDGRYYKQKGLITFGLSPTGLTRLGLPQETLDTFPPAFRKGMHERERILGDVGENGRANWAWGREGHDVSLLVYGSDAAEVRDLETYIADLADTYGIETEHRVALDPIDKNKGPIREPFGFVDGVSQPAIRGTYRALRTADPIHMVEPGEFVLGYPDNRGNIPPGPEMDPSHDPDMRLPIAGTPHGFAETRAENARLPAYNGSFLVIRQLFQHVDRFEEYCETEGAKLEHAFPEIPVTATWSDFVGAKLIGRWKDGSSLVRNPYISASELREKFDGKPPSATTRPATDPADPDAAIDAPIPLDPPAGPDGGGTPPSGSPGRTEKPVKPDNDFLYGTEDPQGQRCPFGAHIRRTNPRESFIPGSEDQIAISNRHRLLRVGRGYREEGSDKADGLMFMCLNADLERQFEFVQQTWMNSVKFHGLDAEADPIAVNDLTNQKGFTIPTRRGPVMLGQLPQFVTMKGGGYFFVPGRQLLEFLAEGSSSS